MNDPVTAESPSRTVKRNWRESRAKRIKVALAAAAAKLLVRLLLGTVRMHKIEMRHLDLHRPRYRSFLFAAFHGPHFPLLWAYRGHPFCIITSQSADGEILTRVLHHFGFRTVRGSSSHGGARAMADLSHELERGYDVAIAVDGPRGPRCEVKPGILLLSKLTGSPIIPLAIGQNRYWQFNSWDRFRLPKPFSRVLIVIGEPITVPSHVSHEQMAALREQLQARLIAVQAQADEAVRSTERAQAMLAACEQMSREIYHKQQASETMEPSDK